MEQGCVGDFQAMLETGDGDLENMRVKIEIKRGANEATVAEIVNADIKRVFEVSTMVEVQELGTLAKVFESSIKAPRFVDERS